MTDNLIGPKPDGPTFPTPWQADFDRILDADDEVVFYLGHVDQPLLIGIVDAVSAYYDVAPEGKSKARVQRDYWRQQAETKDTRIVALEGRAQVAEELVKKLQKEAGKRNERWAIMVREVDKRDARIAELEDQLEFHRNRTESDDAQIDHWKRSYLGEYQRALKAEARVKDADWKLKKSEMRVKTAEDRLKEVDSDRWGLLNRAEDAEVYRDVNRKRAEKAEARVRDLEHQLEGATESLEEARSAYLQLSKERMEESVSDLVSRMAIPSHSIPVDTYTAPDGRVFRVGQRVWHIWDEPGEFGHVTDINGGFPLVQFQDAEDQTPPDSLRRVWDGSEEPDVPVGTVLRDADGLYLGRLPGGWSLYHSGTGNWSGPNEWDDWAHDGGVVPYVEWLPGDDE